MASVKAKSFFINSSGYNYNLLQLDCKQPKKYEIFLTIQIYCVSKNFQHNLL